MGKNLSRYHYVKSYILAGIANGSWGTGERVPSENELTDLCNVSRMTARRALQELLLEGRLVRIKGKGSFVAEEKQQSSLLQINSIASEIKEQGHIHSSQLLSIIDTKANNELASSMNLAIDSELYYSQLLHFKDERPIQLENRWVNPEVIPGYVDQDFSTQTPNEYLSEIAAITEAKHSIEAIIGTTIERELLQVTSNEALLLLKRTTWCGNQLVSFAKLFHPGNRYSFGTKFKPRS